MPTQLEELNVRLEVSPGSTPNQDLGNRGSGFRRLFRVSQFAVVCRFAPSRY